MVFVIWLGWIVDFVIPLSSHWLSLFWLDPMLVCPFGLCGKLLSLGFLYLSSTSLRALAITKNCSSPKLVWIPFQSDEFPDLGLGIPVGNKVCFPDTAVWVLDDTETCSLGCSQSRIDSLDKISDQHSAALSIVTSDTMASWFVGIGHSVQLVTSSGLGLSWCVLSYRIFITGF